MGEELIDSAAAPRGTLAWRIAQNMKGCSPHRIDSVIQAHLPQRDYTPSTRPDPLQIPGLKGEKPRRAAVSLMPKAHEETFFKGNPMLHPELSAASGHGYIATPLPYQLWRDSWVTGSLLALFVLLFVVINRTRDQFALQLRNFFYTPQSTESTYAKGLRFGSAAVVVMTLQLSLLGGFVTYLYAQSQLDLFLSQISPYKLYTLYVGIFLAYFIARRMLYAFADWVFFARKQHTLWLEATSLVLAIECLLAFPCVLTFVYFSLSLSQLLTAVGALVVASWILLAIKCWSIFFKHLHCLLHFFIYLCTLEIATAVVLVRVLGYVTGNLVVKW